MAEKVRPEDVFELVVETNGATEVEVTSVTTEVFVRKIAGAVIANLNATHGILFLRRYQSTSLVKEYAVAVQANDTKVLGSDGLPWFSIYGGETLKVAATNADFKATLVAYDA